jgi:hypothetical protein
MKDVQRGFWRRRRTLRLYDPRASYAPRSSSAAERWLAKATLVMWTAALIIWTLVGLMTRANRPAAIPPSRLAPPLRFEQSYPTPAGRPGGGDVPC